MLNSHTHEEAHSDETSGCHAKQLNTCKVKKKLIKNKLYIKLRRLLTSILDWQNVTRLRIKFLAVFKSVKASFIFFTGRAWCTTSSIFRRISNSVGPVGIKRVWLHGMGYLKIWIYVAYLSSVKLEKAAWITMHKRISDLNMFLCM